MARSLLTKLAVRVRQELGEYFSESGEMLPATRTQRPVEAFLAALRGELGALTVQLHELRREGVAAVKALDALKTGTHAAINQGREDLAQAVFEEQHALKRRAADIEAETLLIERKQAALSDVILEFSAGTNGVDPDDAARAAKLKEFLALVRISGGGDSEH